MQPASLANLALSPRWQPGVSPNPGGKPTGIRNGLTTRFLKALSDDFDAHGKPAIVAARKKDPVGYMKVIAALLPKQVEAIEPMGELGDHELMAMIAFLRAKLSEMTPEALENLRGQMAVAPAPAQE